MLLFSENCHLSSGKTVLLREYCPFERILKIAVLLKDYCSFERIQLFWKNIVLLEKKLFWERLHFFWKITVIWRNFVILGSIWGTLCSVQQNVYAVLHMDGQICCCQMIFLTIFKVTYNVQLVIVNSGSIRTTFILVFITLTITDFTQ